MCKEILTFGETEIEKTEFYRNKIPIFFFKRSRFLYVKKTINVLLVTCIVIIKLSHYI